MTARSLAPLVAVVLALSLSGPATAQPTARTGGLKPAARAHLQAGMKLYEQERYAEAITELREGLAIDPQPDILYALGQAERKRGDCGRAVEYYRSCLALVGDAAAAAAIKVQIERCQVSSGSEAPKAFEVEPWPTDKAGARPEAAALTPVAPPPPPAAEPSRDGAWRHDPLALTALALGVGGVVAGGVLVGLARARLDVAGDSYQSYADARGWPSVRTGGVVSLAVGGALMALGVVRYAVLAGRAHRSGR